MPSRTASAWALAGSTASNDFVAIISVCAFARTHASPSMGLHLLEYSGLKAKLCQMIGVKHLAGDEWSVTVQGSVTTHHRVRVTNADLARFSEGRPLEELLRVSFQFLLEREPNTSILTSFDLPLIGHYFPEYEQDIRSRLRRA